MISKVFLLVFFTLFITGCQVELHSNLEEQEANKMMSKLLAQGVNVSKVSDGKSISLTVNSKQFGQAVEILESHGLPERTFSTMSEIFENDGLVASPLQEWARFNYAKAQELSQSISTIPGVLKADVHIASSRQQTAFDEVSPPGASVLIQMKADMITPNLIPQIKQLVTFSIPDIEYERVGVIVSPIFQEDTKLKIVSFFGVLMPEDSAREMWTGLIILGIIILIIIIMTGFGSFLFGRKQASSKGA